LTKVPDVTCGTLQPTRRAAIDAIGDVADRTLTARWIGSDERAMARRAENLADLELAQLHQAAQAIQETYATHIAAC
jgi:hypothetical protein